MRQNKLINLLDGKRIEAAITEAEARTTGEIRVSVSPFFLGNVHKVAERAFTRLGMTATKERNGVLFFIVPARRKFTILGDAGIHEKVGQEFWQNITAEVAGHFQKGEFTEGLVHGIKLAGEELARHFPCGDKPRENHMTDEIDYGK